MKNKKEQISERLCKRKVGENRIVVKTQILGRETRMWRTPVMVWAAFLRWDYSLRVGVLSKDTLRYYKCRRFDFKSSRPDRSKVGRSEDSFYFHFPICDPSLYSHCNLSLNQSHSTVLNLALTGLSGIRRYRFHI